MNVQLIRPVAELGTQRDVVGKRVAAFLIDIVAVVAVIFVVSAVVGIVSDLLGFLVSLVLSVAALVYFVYMEGTYGQTIGKRLMGIVVVREDGSPLDMRAAAIRNVARIVDAFPTLYIVGFAAMYLVGEDRQRVGDLVADTMVVAVDSSAAAETTETPVAGAA
jgi:uncharacterized RDD family membrane protein YckC